MNCSNDQVGDQCTVGRDELLLLLLIAETQCDDTLPRCNDHQRGCRWCRLVVWFVAFASVSCGVQKLDVVFAVHSRLVRNYYLYDTTCW